MKYRYLFLTRDLIILSYRFLNLTRYNNFNLLYYNYNLSYNRYYLEALYFREVFYHIDRY